MKFTKIKNKKQSLLESFIFYSEKKFKINIFIIMVTHRPPKVAVQFSNLTIKIKMITIKIIVYIIFSINFYENLCKTIVGHNIYF